MCSSAILEQSLFDTLLPSSSARQGYVLKQPSKTPMFPVLSGVLKDIIPKHRNWLSMTGLRFFPLFLMMKLTASMARPMLGLYITPHLSSILFPSSSTQKLYFSKMPSWKRYVCCAVPSSIRSKTKRVFAKMNGCASSIPSIFVPKSKKRTSLTHAVLPKSDKKENFAYSMSFQQNDTKDAICCPLLQPFLRWHRSF